MKAGSISLASLISKEVQELLFSRVKISHKKTSKSLDDSEAHCGEGGHKTFLFIICLYPFGI